MIAIHFDAYQLIVFAFFSLMRMFSAMLLSVLFAVIVGMAAARRKRVGRVLIAILDILQSVPILGFFPAAIFFFVLLYGNVWGVEMAAVFLIFTSMAWNMAFSVYESVTTIPDELLEVSEVFGLSPWRRFTTLYLPATVPRLVYNMLLSWAGGWYFLTAAEIIAFGAANYALPGLGRFIAQSASTYSWLDLGAGIVVLVAVILTIEYLLWHPLEVYSERFKYESTGSQIVRPVVGPMMIGHRIAHSRGFVRLRGRLLRRTAVLSAIISKSGRLLGSIVGRRLFHKKAFKRAVALIVTAVVLLILYDVSPDLLRGTRYLVEDTTKLMSSSDMMKEMYSLPVYLGYSVSRLAAAYVISVVWTIPVAYLIGRSERAMSVVLPFFEVVASIPGIAYFPLILVLLLDFSWGPNLASVVLVLTGMQWYLLFNVVAGMRSIPNELSEASNMFGLKGTRLWKVLILPVIAPTFVTGSITAWGGGWNALIVSEYIAFTDRTIRLPGLGGFLDAATFVYGNIALMLIGLFVMSAFIITLNSLVWHRLYSWVSGKYKMEIGT